MGLKLLVTAFLIFTSSQQALADRGGDEKYVMQRFTANNFFEKYRDHFILAYVDVYANMLRERSIKVLDREGFARLLPPSIADGQVALHRNFVETQCLNKFSNEEVLKLAQTLKKYPQDPNASQKTPDDDGLVLRAMLSVTMCALFGSGTIVDHMKQNGERPPTAYLPKILRDSSIVSFPNRIVQQSAIAEFSKKN